MTVAAQEPLDIAARDIREDEPETLFGNATMEYVGIDEPDAEQRMKIIEVSGALDFWDRPQENIYTLDDGDPVR